MHPFQNQAKIMWDLVKRKISADKKESWVESMSLSYTLIEIGLRFLLSSKTGASGTPVPPEEIDRQKYLMDLANLAKEKEFIDETIWEKIKEFNSIRRKSIHSLAQGKIKYEDLEEPALQSLELLGDIQNCWLTLEWGPEESFEN